MDADKTWVSLKEAAVMLGITEGAVRRRIRKGLIEARKVPGEHGERYEVNTGFKDARDGPEPSGPTEAERLREVMKRCETIQTELVLIGEEIEDIGPGGTRPLTTEIRGMAHAMNQMAYEANGRTITQLVRLWRAAL